MIDLRPDAADARRTAHEMVKDALRQAILRGSLPGGTRLVQADIASQLEISTTPVREALRDLATEGLIVVDPHRGAVVKQLSPEELSEIHDICMLLEPEGVRRAAPQMSPQVLAQARALADEMETEEDVGRWADLNRQFHALLVRDGDSTRLINMLNGLRDSAAPYVGLALRRRSTHVAEANDDHRALLQALEEGDIDRAAEISERHLALTIKVLASLDESAEYDAAEA